MQDGKELIQWLKAMIKDILNVFVCVFIPTVRDTLEQRFWDIQNLNPNSFSPDLLTTLNAFCEPPFPNQYLAHPSYKGLSMQIHYLSKHSMAISQNSFIDNCIVMLFDGKRESITVSLWLKEERTIGRLLIFKYFTGRPVYI